MSYLKALPLITALLVSLVSCSESDEPQEPEPTAEEKQSVETTFMFPVDSESPMPGIDNLHLDMTESHDGNGSWRIETTDSITAGLLGIGNIDIEDALLVYQAHVKTDSLHGQAFLEMWCYFSGKGRFFSRDLRTPLSGTTDWSREHTPFRLKAGENPDSVYLNIVIDGTGTVWVDEIRLLRGPLPE
jgi:hypothetical protein